MMIKTLIAMIVAAQATAAQAGDFDPTDFLRHQEFEASKRVEAVRHSIVVVDGVAYRRLETDAGSIVVPKLDDISRADLERAHCLASDPGQPVEQAATVTAAELKVVEKVRLYSSLILETVHRKCDGATAAETGTKAVRPHGDLEVGVKWRGEGRDPATYSIFNRNLKPNIGVRADF